MCPSMKIISGSGDNFVQVWDASTGVELEELKGHLGPVTSVAFSSDGTQIVVFCRGNPGV